MSENEAIKYIETHGSISDEVKNMAINAIKEIRQYRFIGTIDECREAVEKQTAMEPINNDKCTCPSCGTYNEIVKKRRNTVVCDVVYCWHCGQALECRRDIDLG